MKVHDRIRTARERADLGLRELARRTGVSATQQFRVESGDCVPSEGHLRAICEHTALDLDSVMRQLGRVPEEVARYVIRTPGILERLRREMSAA